MSDEIFEPHPMLKGLRNNPLAWVKERLDKVIVGEDNNKLLLFLSKLSYLTHEPLHCILKGESSAGKSWLAENVLRAFPEDDVIKVSRVTPAWLDRCKDLKNKILFVQQLGGAESIQSSLHVMLSEKGLVLGTVKRGEGGNWEPYYVQTEGPVSFVSTTTRLMLDPQLETRCFHVYPDESPEQTLRIQKLQQIWDECPWKKEEALEAVKEIRELVEFVKKYGVKKVIVPFSRLITLPSKNLRIRRDRPKLMGLVKTLAMLNQWKRFVLEIKGERYVLAEWEDFLDVLHIAEDVLTATMQELSRRERQIRDWCFKAFGQDWFSTKQAAVVLNMSQRTTRRYLNRLVDKGHMFLEREGRGRGLTNMYSVNVHAMENFQKTVFAGLTVLPKQELRNALKAWVTENVRNGRADVYKYDEEGTLKHYGYIQAGKLVKEV